MNVATILAVAGVALSLVIVWIHAQMDKFGDGYTSFCNISTSINCDLVLASPFARIFGVPIAWLALLAYAVLALLYQTAARSSATTARTALILACAGSVGAAGFAAYMAFVSFYVLRTICPMCTGLYVISLGLLTAALLAPSRYARLSRNTGAPPLSTPVIAGCSLVALLAVAGIAAASWPTPADVPALSANASLEDIRKADPEFYAWYLALPVMQVPEGNGHVMGSPKAPVTIVEFSDFECAYCSRNHVLLNQLLERRPELVRVVYRHFPLDASCNEALETSVHTRACRAAEVAECAAQQGRFHEMANDLFANQRRLFENYLFTLAERAGLDMDAFRACMSEHGGRDAILADTREGARLKISSTPTLFINGRQVIGTLADLDRYDYAVLIESRLRDSAVQKAAR